MPALSPLRTGFMALVLGNMFLVFGPVLVRMSDTGPIASAFWRIALAAPVLVAIAVARSPEKRMPSSGAMLLFFCAGLFFAADLAVWHLGILKTKLANGNLLANCTSFLLPLWAFVSTRKQPSRTQFMALLLAFFGTLLLMGQSYELSPAHLFGDLLCFMAGVFYTGYLILMARTRSHHNESYCLAWATVMSMAPLFLTALAAGEKIMPDNWTPLLLLAVCSQVIGQGLMLYAIGRVPPMLFGMTLLLQSLLSVVIGWYRYGEAFAAQDWLGAALIAVAIILARKPEPLRS
jgi:drug/metabolite transporter (DMT)-like permease